MDAKNELGKIASMKNKKIKDNYSDFKNLISALYIDPADEGESTT